MYISVQVIFSVKMMFVVKLSDEFNAYFVIYEKCFACTRHRSRSEALEVRTVAGHELVCTVVYRCTSHLNNVNIS